MQVFEDEEYGFVDFTEEFIQKQSRLIADCYLLTFNKPIFDLQNDLSDLEFAKTLFFASGGILSHDIVNGDNIYNYANLAALKIFERSYQQQTGIPSSKSAQEDNSPQRDRNNLLANCLFHGSAEVNTSRLTGKGRTVKINNGELFNLANERGIYSGQAILIDPNKILYSPS